MWVLGRTHMTTYTIFIIVTYHPAAYEQNFKSYMTTYNILMSVTHHPAASCRATWYGQNIASYMTTYDILIYTHSYKCNSSPSSSLRGHMIWAKHRIIHDNIWYSHIWYSQKCNSSPSSSWRGHTIWAEFYVTHNNVWYCHTKWQCMIFSYL